MPYDGCNCLQCQIERNDLPADSFACRECGVCYPPTFASTAYPETCCDCAEGFDTECCACNRGLDTQTCTTLSDGRDYCDACHRDRIAACFICGERCDTYDAGVESTRRGFICASCVEARDNNEDGDEDGDDEDSRSSYDSDARGSIHSHSWSPRRPTYLHLPTEKISPNTLFFGAEVECENVKYTTSNERAAASVTATKVAYCKDDGSLSDGFETVTHPFTFDYMRCKLLADLAPLWKLADDGGFRSFNTTTCGMHVHMSKAAFSSSHLYKMLRFIYASPPFVAAIARRHGNSLNQWASPAWDCYQTQARTARRKYLDGKYRALNLQKESTVECRIFKGTLSKNGFAQNVEFCHAAYSYTAQASMREAGQILPFYEFVTVEKAKTYKRLAAFMARHSSVLKVIAGERAERRQAAAEKVARTARAATANNAPLPLWASDGLSLAG